MLLIDAGNTFVKWRLKPESSEPEEGRFPTPRFGLSPAIGESLDKEWGELAAPSRVLVASVAGAAFDAALRDWIASRWNVPAEFVVPRRKAFGVTNGYRKPDQLGADRWAALVASRERAQSAACVIDVGSALTFDLMDAEGQHHGGLILPGLAMMRRSLAVDTARIAESETEAEAEEEALLARDTHAAVTAGTLYGVIAVIDRVCADLAAEVGGELERFLTGGDAPTVAPLLSAPPQHVPSLILDGLDRIARSRGGSKPRSNTRKKKA